MMTSLKSTKPVAVLIIGATILAIGLSGCNTVEGAGQDIKSAGKAIEKTADKNK
jgi:entericidin B